ncbi:MAG: permease-like cell division protein FtsX [Acutalibacteraceae bacterium]|nr:ABC transporter permease [Clostridia bacterium]MEE1329613.1 permease-like cell division protein FtsX [Acutalibacteraceae bacterium]
MKVSSVRYLVKEGAKNAWVNRLMTLASVGVLVACMVIIGLAILISENVNKAVGKLEQQNVVMAYMKDYNWALYGDKTDASSTDTSSAEDSAAQTSEETQQTEEQADENGIKNSDYVIHNDDEAKALCDKIAQLDNVASVTYVTSDEGLESVKKSMLEGQESYFTFLDDKYGNPMSGAAKITMKNMEQFDDTVNQIKNMDGIDTVQSQNDLADKITAIKRGITVAGFWIIAILMVIALVIVSNTIRVTMYNRKLEISIMKAVGATDSFVRIPFVVEGMIIGLISAVLAEGLLYFCYRVATETIISTLGTSDIVRYGDVAWWLLLVFAGIGVFAGILGSVIMISKYLRHEGSEFSAI